MPVARAYEASSSSQVNGHNKVAIDCFVNLIEYRGRLKCQVRFSKAAKSAVTLKREYDADGDHNRACVDSVWSVISRSLSR